MKRSKLDAKDWAKERIRGIYGAAPVPYLPDGAIDEDGFRRNLRYWRDVLHIKGQWVAGFQSEQLGISTAQRQRLFELTQAESTNSHIAICAVMDDVIQDALELVQFADQMGADCVGLSGPRVFTGMLGRTISDDTIYQYFEYICARVDIPVVLLNQASMQGYNMSPQLLARIAALPNAVALKNAISKDYGAVDGAAGDDLDHYHTTRKLCGDLIVVSDPFEHLFFENYTQHGQRAFIASSTPMLLQTRDWQPMNDYVRLADAGDLAAAAQADASLEPVRTALRTCLEKLGWYKYTALAKCWFELQGLVGGCVVYPQQELTATEKDFVKAQFAACMAGQPGRPQYQAA